jgi:hypothetical protein
MTTSCFFCDRCGTMYFKSRQINKVVLYEIGECYLPSSCTALSDGGSEIKISSSGFSRVEDKKDFRQGSSS